MIDILYRMDGGLLYDNVNTSFLNECSVSPTSFILADSDWLRQVFNTYMRASKMLILV